MVSFYEIFNILVFAQIIIDCKTESLNENHLKRLSSKVFRNGRLLSSPIKLPSNFEEKQQHGSFDLIEGDILVPKFKKTRSKRKIIDIYDREINSRTRWPNKIVPFEFDSKMSDFMKQRINDAFKHWHTHTCIRFEPYDAVKHRTHHLKLNFLPSEICGSFVGYREDKLMDNSDVYLSSECSLGTVIHELGHTIGFRHEQSRVDRDDHVNIDWNKIGESSVTRDQYYTMENSYPGYYGVQYDLFSVMHYSSQNGIIKALDPKRNFLMGQRIGLSFLDIKLANLAYSCSEYCPVKVECQNEGFMNQFCKCECPESFTGSLCETVIAQLDKSNENSVQLDEKEFSLNCDFSERSFCGWILDRLRASDEWTFNKESLKGITETQNYFSPLDPNFKTGPQFGDYKNNIYGSYIYLNSLRKTTSDETAILTTPRLSVKSPTLVCLDFWYHMYAGEGNNPKYPLKIGNLSVVVLTHGGPKQILWLAEGNQGAVWKNVHLEITLQPPETVIYFLAQLTGLNYGDIALSGLKLEKKSCQSSQAFKPAWTEWSACSVTCGSGIQTRSIVCENSLTCRPLSESRKCVLADCPTASEAWSEWTPWSKCTCSVTYNYRVRACKAKDISLCEGNSVEYGKCENQTNCLKNKTRKRSTENQDCGGEYVITQKNLGIEIKSPHYPLQYPSNLKCNYYIKSPPGTKITLYLYDIDLEESNKDTCIDGLELRYYSLGQPGPTYCGNSQIQMNPTQITSYKNFFLIIFRSTWGQTTIRRGFHLMAMAI